MTQARTAGTSCVFGRIYSHILCHLLAVVFLSITTIFSVLPNLSTAQEYTFNSIQVEGNRRIETATIIAYTGITRGQPVSAGALNGAYQRILDSGVFETVELDPRGGTLVIKVTEFPTINRINFEGNRRIKDEALSEFIEFLRGRCSTRPRPSVMLLS